MKRVPLLAVVLAGCSAPPAPVPPPAPYTAVSLGDRPGLHNVFRLTNKLLTGSGPEGDVGFRSLRELGVVTVVSVDGGPPDVEAAKRWELRYAHVPVGYDGVPRAVAVGIARVVRDSPGPVYVHCHHGKHRGPAAGVAALRCLDDRCDAKMALAFLTAAGTDPHYRGLFADVERTTAADPGELERAAVPPEVAAVVDLARVMIGVDETWGRLKKKRSADDALLLVEHYREAGRLPAVAGRPADFRVRLGGAEKAATELEAALRAGDGGRADKAFSVSAAACAGCHNAHRDTRE